MSLSTEANRLRRAVDDGESFRDPAASLARQELGPLVLAGWCVAGGTEDHWLAASSAMRKAAGSDSSLPASYAALLLPPYQSHPVVLTNLVLGLAETDSLWTGQEAQLLSRLLGPFLRHACAASVAVREQSLDALNEMPEVAFSQWSREDCVALRDAGSVAVEAARYPEVREDLESGIASIPETEDAPTWHRHWSDALRGTLSVLGAEVGGGTAGVWAAAALEPLRAFVAAAPLGQGVPVVQKVSLRSYRRRQVSERDVLPVSKAWTELFHSWMAAALPQLRPQQRPPAFWSPVALQPAASQLGSFQLYWLVEPTDDAEIEILAALGELGDEERATPDATVQPWKHLLEVLAAGGTAIEVTHFHGAKNWPLTIDKEGAGRRFERLPRRRVTGVPSPLVPQANSLERVYRLVELVARGVEVTAESLDVDPRQVDYYYLAAVALRMLDEDRALAPAGRQFMRLEGDARHALVAVLFETSEVGDAWVVWSDVSNVAEVDPNTATAFLTECGRGLSGTTIPRRASTLENWARALAPHHYSRR